MLLAVAGVHLVRFGLMLPMHDETGRLLLRCCLRQVQEAMHLQSQVQHIHTARILLALTQGGVEADARVSQAQQLLQLQWKPPAPEEGPLIRCSEAEHL